MHACQPLLDVPIITISVMLAFRFTSYLSALLIILEFLEFF